MEKEEAVMEESDLTAMEQVTPYELATLASKICPNLCMENPTEAINVVQRLLRAARSELFWEEERERGSDERYRYEEETRVDWASGVRSITGEQRLERASKRFIKFLREQNPDGVELITYKREGFTLLDTYRLGQFYRTWKEKPKPKKGKQGRRISERDGRLRLGALKLACPKTAKAA